MYDPTERWRPGQRSSGDGAPSPPPLPLPLLPGLPGYRAFDAEVRRLDFRHAVDVLEPASEGNASRFRVVDGLWFPGPGLHSLRVDADWCLRAADGWRRRVGDPRSEDAARLADRLAGIVVAEDGPTALRRLVLYQLCCRLRDAPVVDEQAALALGVHPAEALPLAEATRACFPGPGPVREAAEEIADAWRARRLARVVELLDALPDVPGDAPHADPFLVALRAEARAAQRAVATALARARRLTASGEHAAASRLCLRIARATGGDALARAGMLEAAAHAADAGPRPEITAVPDAGGVRLSWPAARLAGVSYQVLRFPDGGPAEAVDVTVTADTSSADTSCADISAVDPEPPPAVSLRYAVIPWRGGRMAGVAKASGLVRSLPAPERPHARAVPDGVRITWRAHPATRRARAFRVADGMDLAVPCAHDSLTDRPLAPGTYHYRVACGYTAPDGQVLWSAERLVVARAVEWPTPIEGGITGRRLPSEGLVDLSWSAPARGEGRLVPWGTGPPPTPGEDCSDLAGSAPYVLTAREPGPDGRQGAVAAMAPRAATRLVAVSVLGDRAVAGPSVILENPGTVAGLSVRRLDTRRAEVRFQWPEPAVLAMVTWRSGRRGEQRRLARSQHLRDNGRVVIPVSRAAHVVTVTPVARPDAAVAECGTALAQLASMPLARVVLTRAWQATTPVLRRAWRATASGLRRAVGAAVVAVRGSRGGAGGP
ncbi:hypothetical protein ACTWP5_08985 [Streptomyces sp. 4N509B]|uniref:hypothetical protein n=1 Tax=Streptomyces sp. 4N509B TaxID=3457413 RepID=UPI003FD2727C